MTEDDERIGAPLVVVIGHEVWQRRFNSAPSVIGRSVRVGAAQATIVGVMPDEFAYPIAQQIWLPLRLNPLDAPRLEGPSIIVVGRLVQDASLSDARAELEAFGRAAAAELPETHKYLQLQVMPYASSVLNTSLGVSGELDLATLRQLLPASINAFVLLFMVLVCGNVALLMFARAATRESEIIVRNALGASRRRIVLQLFLEALVLGIVAAALGLAAARYGLRWGLAVVQIQAESVQLPFWFKGSLSASTLLYAGLLTVLAAGIAGVLPALKITRDLGTRLRQAGARGGGFRFGGVWTAVIVAQVAITMPLPLVSYAVTAEAQAIRAVDVGFEVRDYMSLRLELADETNQPGRGDTMAVRQLVAELAESAEVLQQRLQAEPALAGITFANRLPRMYHPYRLIEVDGGGAAPIDPRWPAYRVSTATVAPNFFDVLGIRPVAGRVFHSADLKPGTRPIIVNESFVQQVLGGRSAIGRRVRYAPGGEYDQPHQGKDEPWFQIVGVVPDAGMSYDDEDPKISGFYHPGSLASMRPLTVALRVVGNTADVAPRLRTIAASVDPRMQIYDMMPMNQIIEREVRFYTFWFYITMVLTSVALALSLAGIYAIMSFTVSQRTREIGIRIALGADAWRIVFAVFRRPMRQVGLGIFMGAALLGLAVFGDSANINTQNVVRLLVYTAIMLMVCMLAWIVPTRRALSVQPTEALNAEG